MKKLLFVLFCIALLVPIAQAKVTQIGGAPVLTVKKTNELRYQSVRIIATSFTRTVDGARHVLSVEKIDKAAKKIMFVDRCKGKAERFAMNYDAKGMGKMNIGGKTYQLIFDPKYSSAKIEY
jgi:hypothetical protein